MSQHNPHRRQRSALAQSSDSEPTLLLASQTGTRQLVDSAVRAGPVVQSVGELAAPAPAALSVAEQRRFHALYCEHFDFVFRNLRRLGVPAASTDDALQEVFLVVLRRLRDLTHNTHTKAWLFAILLRVASNQRRSLRRRGAPEPFIEQSQASAQPGPFDLTARSEAAQFLHSFLRNLDDQRRAVFIMAELEQLTAPEIAHALGAKLNTVYSWLRGARIAFSKALEDLQAVGADHE